MSTNDPIDEFCDAMARGLASRSLEPGVDVWPQPVFSPFEGNSFAHGEVFSQLYSSLQRLKDKGLGPPEIAGLFLYPSRTAHLTYLFLERPANPVDAQIRTEVARSLLSYIALLRNGDPYCKKGNAVWSKEESAKVLSQTKFEDLQNISGRDKIKSLVSKIIVGLSAYCEFLYFANLAYGREVHGTYAIGGDGLMVVRDYFDLQPAFWHFSKEFPFKSIRLLTAYPKFKARFDFAGRFFSQKPLGHNLLRIYIEVEGDPYPIKSDALAKLLTTIQDYLANAEDEIRDMGRRQLMSKWVEAIFWALKPLQDRLGLDWHPPAELYARINTEEPDKWLIRAMGALSRKPEQERIEALKVLFDPRILKTDKGL